MTIREYVTKRARIFMALAFASWLFIAVSMALFKQNNPILTFIGFAGFGAAVLGMVFLVRCPKCHGMLGWLGAGGSLAFGTRRFNHCPYCGVSFDDQA